MADYSYSDPRGTKHPGAALVRVQMIRGVQFEGRGLAPGAFEELPEGFARGLVAENRARWAPLPATAPETIEHQDPVVQHRDPAPRRKRS